MTNRLASNVNITPVSFVDEGGVSYGIKHIDNAVMASIYPFVDIDTTFTYNEDKTVATMVQTGLNKTKTLVFTWDAGALQSIACVIT